MCDKKIEIRAADKSDCKDIYAWRSDIVSRTMFFNSNIPTYEEHFQWFNSSLNNQDCKLYIGEISATKIGVCRFDYDTKSEVVEVSINMNPKCRGCGYGKRFLASSISEFQKDYKSEFLAKIKPENLASLKIFKSVGFQEISFKEDMIVLVKCDRNIKFKEVDGNDAEVLFDLLRQRVHSISHIKTPTWDEHEAFVKANPYRYWAIIMEDDCPIGTFYLQDDNSVGLNINEPTLYLVSQILTNIRRKFEPLGQKKSKVPPYFYVNASCGNEKLGQLLIQCEAKPIQISYKI
jgi:L-amino acid N-acyltransferase YncA